MLSTGSRIGAASGITERRARSVRQVAVWIVVSLALGAGVSVVVIIVVLATTICASAWAGRRLLQKQE
jgi:hypothetical protein